MPGFDAAEAVEPIRYRFTTVAGYDGPVPEHADSEGWTVIPEFSDRQLEDFAAAALGAVDEEEEEASKPGKVSDRDALIRMMSPERLRKSNDQIVDAVARFCQNRPCAAELQGLPWRARQRFIGYLFGELFDPKG